MPVPIHQLGCFRSVDSIGGLRLHAGTRPSADRSAATKAGHRSFSGPSQAILFYRNQEPSTSERIAIITEAGINQRGQIKSKD